MWRWIDRHHAITLLVAGSLLCGIVVAASSTALTLFCQCKVKMARVLR